MLRKLIALIALLSGLAAIGAPVHARASELSGSGMVASAPLSAKCQAERSDREAVRNRPSGASKAARTSCRKPVPVIYFPPVMLGPDRAHE